MKYSPLEQRVLDLNTRFEVLNRCETQLETVLNTMDHSIEDLRVLMAYYTGGQFLQDYDADEKGLISKELPRGILSQDGLYDLFESLKEQAKDMTELAKTLETILNSQSSEKSEQPEGN